MTTKQEIAALVFAWFVIQLHAAVMLMEALG